MFVWDEPKRLKVIKDHKIDFALIFDVFEDILPLILKITNIRPKRKLVGE